LLKANIKFIFDVREREAFIQLKEKLSNKPVLNLYRIGAETELHTDASIHGFGASIHGFGGYFYKKARQIIFSTQYILAVVKLQQLSKNIQAMN